MDWKAFIASIIGSLAWPVVVVALLIILRKHLGSLAERIEEITFPGGAKATFLKALEQGRIEKELAATNNPALALDTSDPRLELANRFPEAAVMEAYKEVEEVLLELRKSIDLPPRTNLRSVVRALVEKGLLDSESEPLFASFQQARNASAHAGNENRITRGEALEYMAQARVLKSLFDEVLKRVQSKAGMPGAKQ
jgi:hypothetical protein